MSDSREYPSRPIVGVGVVVQKDDAILLVQRGQAPRRGEWSLPGGAVELGEPLRDTVVREIREECGIEIRVGEIVEAFDLVWHDETGRVQYHFVIIDYGARYLHGELRPASDVMDARWVRVSELISFPLNDKTREVIQKAVSMGLSERENGS